MKHRSLESELKLNAIILLLCIVTFLIISLFFFTQYAKEEQQSKLRNEALHLSSNIKFEMKGVKNNIKALHRIVTRYIETDPQTFQSRFDFAASQMISNYNAQQNTYYALEKSLSQKIYGTDGYVFTVYKDKKLRGTPEYHNPEHFIRDTWNDPSYQKNISESWFHIGKRSREVEFSNAYYDETYLREWLITAGLGIYKNDEYVGIVGIDINLEDLTGFISGYSLGKSGGAILINKSDLKILTSSNNNQAIRNGYQSVAANSMDEVLHFLETNVTHGIYFERVDLEEVPWVLIVYLDKIEMDEKIFIQTSTFALLVVALAFILYFFYLKLNARVAAPVEKFIETLRRDAEIVTLNGHIEGDYSEDSSIMEINVLGEAVNKFIDAVNRNFTYYKNELHQNQKIMDSLDEEVSEQTHTLAKQNEELQTALDELKRTQEKLVAQEKLASLGNLTAGIAHEIKNPLNLLLNGTQVLNELRDSDDPEDRETFKNLTEHIYENAKRLTNIVNSMLNLARNNSETRAFVDINSLISDICSFTFETFKAKTGFSPQIRIDLKGPKKLFLSKEEFSRAIMNLIDNSLYAVREKFGKDQGSNGLIEIFSKEGFSSYEIHVKDNGIGIAEENMKKIFDPFFTTKSPGDGTGLGMSFVHDIIKHHGGDVEVHSVLGEYTEIILKFKLLY